MQNFFSFLQSQSGISLIILSIGVLFSLLLIFVLSNNFKKNFYFFFDKYFSILFLGIIISKILWVFTNLNTYSGLKWSWLPFVQSRDLVVGATNIVWFSTLPWATMTFWDWHINISGVFLLFTIYCFYLSRKNLEKAYFVLFFVGIGLIPFLFAYIIFLEYNFLFFSSPKFEFNLETGGTFLLVLVCIYILNSIIISKKAEDLKILKSTRNPKNDLVKEVANWARMNKFKMTKRSSDNLTNNPTIQR